MHTVHGVRVEVSKRNGAVWGDGLLLGYVTREDARWRARTLDRFAPWHVIQRACTRVFSLKRDAVAFVVEEAHMCGTFTYTTSEVGE